MANLDLWRRKLLAHLKEFNPKTYRELMQAGKLEDYLDRKVDEAARLVAQFAQTMSESEAISEMMAQWLPTPEPEPDPAVDPKEIALMFGSSGTD
jgi:acyl-CoA synthetase (AMP-forming)/AMP-acid ligase II